MKQTELEKVIVKQLDMLERQLVLLETVIMIFTHPHVEIKPSQRDRMLADHEV